MTIQSLIARLRPRPMPARRSEPAATLTLREWADLPFYHPLRRD